MIKSHLPTNLHNTYESIPLIYTQSYSDIINHCKNNFLNSQDYDYIAAIALQLQIIEENKQVLKKKLTAPNVLSFLIDDVGLLRHDLVSSFSFYKTKGINVSTPALGFTYAGVYALKNNYMIKHGPTGLLVENVKTMFLRVALGLANADQGKVERSDSVVALYNLMVSRKYMPSTPTLFNSAVTNKQLSSCYVLTVEDSITDIFDTYKDVAAISKNSGGLAVDFTNIRGAGASIDSVGGTSSGVVPILKIYNDIVLGVNQGGKRRGAGVAYIEVWHSDLLAFLDVKKSTGDDRRRCRDINTALWIPDLFMEYAKDNKDWYLFQSNDVKDLHGLYGREFESRYEEYVKLADNGKLQHTKHNAMQLVELILQEQYEAGQPWIGFKDSFNKRNPQKHCGTIYSSNLCTEIGLNTLPGGTSREIAVCNLGSINLAEHVTKTGWDIEKIKVTVALAVDALNGVLDSNSIPVQSGEQFNTEHRSVGLGIMGLHTALQSIGVAIDSIEGKRLSTEVSELIYYCAIERSIDLAKLYGPYSSFSGSEWSKGLCAFDLAPNAVFSPVLNLDYERLKTRLAKFGIYNSTLTAIAPTASIASICGVSQSIEPIYSNLYVKTNINGNFIIPNYSMIHAIKDAGAWNESTIFALRKSNGSLEDVSSELASSDINLDLYKTAFKVNYDNLLDMAGERQAFLDQSQSLNNYIKEPDGRELKRRFFKAHEIGVKSLYYLRTQAVSNIEIKEPDVCTSCQ